MILRHKIWSRDA